MSDVEDDANGGHGVCSNRTWTYSRTLISATSDFLRQSPNARPVLNSSSATTRQSRISLNIFTSAAWATATGYLRHNSYTHPTRPCVVSPETGLDCSQQPVIEGRDDRDLSLARNLKAHWCVSYCCVVHTIAWIQKNHRNLRNSENLTTSQLATLGTATD